MDSAYIIQVQIDNTEEVIQIFAQSKAELHVVLNRVGESDNIIAAVQCLGPVETAATFLENEDDDLNYGKES